MTLPRRGLLLAMAALPLAACGPAPLQGFADFAAARKAIESLATGWRSASAFNLAQMLEAHTGPLAPHFAYGALDKTQYTRAHLMHLANHWTELVRA